MRGRRPPRPRETASARGPAGSSERPRAAERASTGAAPSVLQAARPSRGESTPRVGDLGRRAGRVVRERHEPRLARRLQSGGRGAEGGAGTLGRQSTEAVSAEVAIVARRSVLSGHVLSFAWGAEKVVRRARLPTGRASK